MKLSHREAIAREFLLFYGFEIICKLLQDAFILFSLYKLWFLDYIWK